MEHDWTFKAHLRDVQQIQCRDIRINQVNQYGLVRDLLLWYELWSPAGQLIYTSEKVVGSLNPEWALLDKHSLSDTPFHSLFSFWIVIKGQVLNVPFNYENNYAVYQQNQRDTKKSAGYQFFNSKQEEGNPRVNLILHKSRNLDRPFRVQLAIQNSKFTSLREPFEILHELIQLDEIFPLSRSLQKFHGELLPNSIILSVKNYFYSHVEVLANKDKNLVLEEEENSGDEIGGGGGEGENISWMGRLIGWRSIRQANAMSKGHKRSSSLRTSPGDLERATARNRKAISHQMHHANLSSFSSIPLDIQNDASQQNLLWIEQGGAVSGDRSDTTTVEVDSGEIKTYDEDDFIMELKKIEDCQKHLQNREIKRNAFRTELSQKLTQKSTINDLKLQIQIRKQRLRKMQNERILKNAQCERISRILEDKTEYVKQKCIIFGNAVDVLYSTTQVVKQLQEELEKKILPAYQQNQLQIISRRCHLIAELGHVFRVGASTHSVWSRKALEEQIDQWWMMPMNPPQQQQIANGTTNHYISNSTRIIRSPPVREIAKLTILGLEVDNQLVQMARDKMAVRDGEKLEVNGAALGYVALLVRLMALYLDVPLRYPICFYGSRSFLIDPYPPQQEARIWTLAYPYDARKLAHNMRYQQFQSQIDPTKEQQYQQQSSQQYMPQRNLVFPLYYSAKKGIRYDYAVFKLNADVKQLLNTYGLSSDSPINVLQNLQKLVEQARAGIPRKKGYYASYLLDYNA